MVNNSVRRRPRKRLQEELLEKQNGCCFYCFRPFGSYVLYKNKERMLTPHFDHIIPYSLTHKNYESNFVAACQLCNQFKSDKVFDSVELIRKYLTEKWLLYNKRGILYDLVDDDDDESNYLDRVGLNGYGEPKI